MLENHFKDKMTEFQSSFQQVLNYLADILKVFPFQESLYNSDELEREYWNALFAMQENIFPVPKGDEVDYTATMVLCCSPLASDNQRRVASKPPVGSYHL